MPGISHHLKEYRYMISVAGINHKTAAIEVREAFYFNKDLIGPLAEEIVEKTSIDEIVILSTCNRTEIYFYKDSPCHTNEISAILEILHEQKNCKGDYSQNFYSHCGEDAVKHLFRVTSGADSMVVGEVEIVSQVKEAYLHSTKLALTDAVLMRLFQKSFETCKRVRSETNIQKGPTSMSYVAMDVCIKKLQRLNDKKVLLIGTGDTGKKALNHLQKKGGCSFILSNRTSQRAEDIAPRFGAKVVSFEEFPGFLPSSDIIITATNAGENLISYSDVSSYMGSGRYSPQIFVDLSVPRNVEEAVGRIENVTLVAGDDLQTVTDSTLKTRNESLQKAEEIIGDMSREYMEWYNNRKLRPLINLIKRNINQISEEELSRLKKSCSPVDYEQIKEYSNRLTQKYSGLLIKNLKRISNGTDDPELLKKIKELFDSPENR